MDDTDARLVALLRRNGRAALSELASHMNVSRATVRNRMERLVSSGEIIGYSVVMKEDVADQPVRGLMMLGIEGRGTERIVRAVTGLPSVQAVHSTNGKWDLVVEIGTETLADLDQVLARIRRVDGVMNSETSLLLATRKALR